MFFYKTISISLLMLIMVACATPYQEKTFFSGGGYSDMRLDENTVRVNFKGNAQTSKDTVENYMLYRAAELTKQYGYDYFIVNFTDTTPLYGSYTTAGKYNEVVSKDKKHGKTYETKTGYYTPGETVTYRLFEASAQIKMFRGKKPNRLNAYDAKSLLNYMSSSIKR